jgi:hypothetical protein
VWLDVTVALGADEQRLAGCATGWAPTFDALLALHRDDPAMALERLTADVEDAEVWGSWLPAMWRPWYAALWSEAAVLGARPDAGRRIASSRNATTDNPIAAALVERAAAIAAGDYVRLETLGGTLAALGCHYQHSRTRKLIDQLM